MKSYSLDGIERPDDIVAALNETLPGQCSPWLLRGADDVIAYFHVIERDAIQVDLSGRHFAEDDAVVVVLRRLQGRIGGQVSGPD